MKILFILLAMISSVFASSDTYTFWVDNATMVDAYWNIFNSMAALFNGSNSYTSLLKLVFLLGGFAVFFTGVLKGFQGSNASAGITDFAKYMIIGTTLLTFIYSQKSTMLIKTNTFPSYCTTETNRSLIGNGTESHTGVAVGNIPMVLAWGFTFANEIGRESTNLAKMAFSNVTSDTTAYQSRSDYASYLSGIGNVMSQTLDKIGSNTEYINSGATVGSAMSTFLKDCIYIPASQDSDHGPQTINALKTTGDSRKTINDLMTSGNLNVYKNPTNLAGTTIVSPVIFNSTEPRNLLTTSFGGTRTCKDLWINTINPKLNELENSKAIECQDSLKDLFSPMSVRILTGEANPTISQARSIALNAAISNQLIDSQRDIAIGEVSFASGKSIAEHVTGSIGTGQYMAQMLPYIQMGMRAVLYAFFPFVFVVVLLPGGIKVLLSYLQSLIWIELWTPTAAILDMFMSLVASNKFQSMYNNEGFNPLNGVQTFTDTAMLASVGGYLYASVPALTWLILKGSGQMLGSLTGAMGARMGANMDSRAINQDMGSINQLKAVNDDRRSKGLATISLAEQDYMASNHTALQEAGKFSANEERKGDLFKSERALNLKQISSGVIESNIRTAFGDKNVDNIRQTESMLKTSVDEKTQKALGLNNFNSIQNNAEIKALGATKDFYTLKTSLGSGKLSPEEAFNHAKAMGITDGAANLLANTSEAGRQKLMGMVDEKGEIKQDRLQEAAKVLATDSATQFFSTEKGQKALKEMTGIKDDKELANFVSSINANKNLIDIQTEGKSQDTLAAIGAKHGLSREESFKMFSTSEGITKGMNQEQNRKFLAEFGLNQNSSQKEIANVSENVSKIIAKEKAIETKSKGVIQANLTPQQRIEANLNAELSKVGTNLNFGKATTIAMDVLGQQGKGGELYEKTKGMSQEEKEKFYSDPKNALKAVGTINSNGIAGQTFSNLTGDEKVRASNQVGLTAAMSAINTVAKDNSDIYGQQKQIEQFEKDSSKNQFTRTAWVSSANREGILSDKTVENSLARLDKSNNTNNLGRLNELKENKNRTSEENKEVAYLQKIAKDNVKSVDMTDEDKVKMNREVTADLQAISQVYSTVSGSAKTEGLIKAGIDAGAAGELQASTDIMKYTEQSFRKGEEESWATANFIQDAINKGNTFGGAVATLTSNAIQNGAPMLKKFLGAKSDQELSDILNKRFGMKTSFSNGKIQNPSGTQSPPPRGGNNGGGNNGKKVKNFLQLGSNLQIGSK